MCLFYILDLYAYIYIYKFYFHCLFNYRQPFVSKWLMFVTFISIRMLYTFINVWRFCNFKIIFGIKIKSNAFFYFFFNLILLLLSILTVRIFALGIFGQFSYCFFVALEKKSKFPPLLLKKKMNPRKHCQFPSIPTFNRMSSVALSLIRGNFLELPSTEYKKPDTGRVVLCKKGIMVATLHNHLEVLIDQHITDRIVC